MKRYWTIPTQRTPSPRAFAAFPDPKPADIPTDPYLADYLARSLHSNRVSLIRAYAWLKDRKL